MKLLSLCTGYGGLDLAVEEYFNAELIGCADIDKYASLAIEKHFNVPNYGDIRNVLDLDIEFDILTAGYPCQPFSHAGQRKGLDDARHIWPTIAQIIGKFRPGIVVLENVRGHLSLGLKEVLKDLASLGYDAKWEIVRASDVGAPHQRARIFIIAYTDSTSREQSRRTDRAIRGEAGQIINGSDRQKSGCSCKDVSNSDHTGRIRDLQGSQGRYDSCCKSDEQITSNSHRERWGSASPLQEISNTNHQQLPADRQMQKLGRRFETRSELCLRQIPDPLVDGKLNPKFVEYMMGLPEGWVTDLPISRAQQFKLLGNGVVPQQALYALDLLWHKSQSI